VKDENLQVFDGGCSKNEKFVGFYWRRYGKFFGEFLLRGMLDMNFL